IKGMGHDEIHGQSLSKDAIQSPNHELFDEIYRTAEIRNCVVDDMTLTNDATNQGWNEYDGGWQ
ncbi:hypothetical protein IFT93_21735, partial [Erwinia persicina]|nr:hypothetical protein [Erwinia persicina]MBD8212138.1 hypothetical protein [Erwinia persicina]